jgi:hypothetical protein
MSVESKLPRFPAVPSPFEQSAGRLFAGERILACAGSLALHNPILPDLN